MEINTSLSDTLLDSPLDVYPEEHISLRSYLGHWVVLFFYPKDNTPGCTTEGIEFNTLINDFKKANALVLGVSKDSVKSHQNFCTKHQFNFSLVSDTHQTLCNAFAVIKEKSIFNRIGLGIERSTFLIDPSGQVVHAWRKVRAAGHAQEVLTTLQSMQKK